MAKHTCIGTLWHSIHALAPHGAAGLQGEARELEGVPDCKAVSVQRPFIGPREDLGNRHHAYGLHGEHGKQLCRLGVMCLMSAGVS